MMSRSNIILTTSPRSQPAKNPDRTPSLSRRQRLLYGRKRHLHTVKERDSETGLYYYGARYLDSKTSRWISGDPAMGEYVPEAPINDEARKRNGSLPGMGGVFNYVNLHVYHYAGNNPVRYTDPDGRKIEWIQGEGVSDEDFALAQQWGEEIKKSDTEAGKRWRAAEDSDKTVRIHVNYGSDPDGERAENSAVPGSDHKMGTGDKLKGALGIGGDAWISLNLKDFNLGDDAPASGEATLAHEMGHAYLMINGRNPWTRKNRELDGTAVDNQYRDSIGIGQRKIYDKYEPGYDWNVPQYNGGVFKIYGTDKNYRLRKVR